MKDDDGDGEKQEKRTLADHAARLDRSAGENRLQPREGLAGHDDGDPCPGHEDRGQPDQH